MPPRRRPPIGGAGQETMTPGPMEFRGLIKITLKSEQRSMLYKQRADIIIAME